MKIRRPWYLIEPFNPVAMMRRVEKAGKTCYKSEGTITKESYDSFIRMIITRGHESVLEHEKITIRLICDRAVSHEIVRHRIASYSQESTRYCNYADDKFGNETTVIDIRPHLTASVRNKDNLVEAIKQWEYMMNESEKTYNTMIKLGVPPQLARSVLPNSLKTEIVITMNLREWRHFFKLRTAKNAHPQMREITIPLFKDFKKKLPAVFYDMPVPGS